MKRCSAQSWSTCVLRPLQESVTEGAAYPVFPSMHCLMASPGTTQSVLWTRAQAGQGFTAGTPSLARGLFSSWSQNDCHQPPLSQGQQYPQTWPEAQVWCPISLGWPNLGFVLGMNEVARGSWSGLRDQIGILRGPQRAPWRPVPGSCICVWSQALGKSDNRGKPERDKMVSFA